MAAKKKATKAAKEKTSGAKKRKRDALELWGVDGPLADAMRAGGCAIGPAAYAAASMDTCLQHDGVRVRVEDGARVYSAAGRDFATLAIEGDELVLRFEAPRASPELDKARAHYRPVPGHAGWLEFRRPATRAPGPGLAANVGAILGAAAFARRRS